MISTSVLYSETGFVKWNVIVWIIFYPLQSPNYEIKKKRCKYLRSKLAHIKRKISEYDHRPWAFTSDPLMQGRRQICNFPAHCVWVISDLYGITIVEACCFYIICIKPVTQVSFPEERDEKKLFFLNFCFSVFLQPLWVSWRTILFASLLKLVSERWDIRCFCFSTMDFYQAIRLLYFFCCLF